MITPKGHQCDGCDKMIDPADVLASKFYKTTCPLIIAESEQAKPVMTRMPAKLILCLSCSPKVTVAFKTRNVGAMPDGRLRKIVSMLVLKYGWSKVKFF